LMGAVVFGAKYRSLKNWLIGRSDATALDWSMMVDPTQRGIE